VNPYQTSAAINKKLPATEMIDVSVCPMPSRTLRGSRRLVALTHLGIQTITTM
jgi:hypothetical protein